MSKLDKLIEELCPDGVEYRKLGELGQFYGGLSGKNKNDFVKGNSKLITYMNVFSNHEINLHVDDRVLIKENEKQNTIEFGDIIFTASSESLFESGMSSVLTINTDEKLYLNSFCFGFRLNDKNLLLPSFSKHLFRSNRIRKQIIKCANGVTRFNLSRKRMENISIPLPPLPIQEEIVRILDNFTELTAELTVELTAELTARKKQYEYYRDELLTFGDEVEWRELEELSIKTSNIRWDLEKEDTIYQYIDLTSVDRDMNYITETQEINKNNAPSRAQQIVKTGDVLFGTTRPLLKRYCNISAEFDNQICSTGFCVLRANTDLVSPKWLYYNVASSNFYIHVERFEQGASYPAISDSNVKKYRIPIPPLAEQERIVSILDKFDALVNDISIGLPAEIEARQKQYEYYREKLLSFKELDVKEA
jgi:type I restriction enzyme S subunit